MVSSRPSVQRLHSRVEAILGLGVPLVEGEVRLVAGLQAQVDLMDSGVHSVEPVPSQTV